MVVILGLKISKLLNRYESLGSGTKVANQLRMYEVSCAAAVASHTSVTTQSFDFLKSPLSGLAMSI